MATARRLPQVVPPPPVIQVDLTWDEAAMIVALFGRDSTPECERRLLRAGDLEPTGVKGVQEAALRAVKDGAHYDVYMAIKDQLRKRGN